MLHKALKCVVLGGIDDIVFEGRLDEFQTQENRMGMSGLIFLDTTRS